MFSGEAVKRITQYVTTSNKQTLGSKFAYDESVLVTKITNHLSEKKSKNDAMQFLQRFEKLSTVVCQSMVVFMLTP